MNRPTQPLSSLGTVQTGSTPSTSKRRRVRIVYHFSRFSDKLSLQKVRDAYPRMENEIQSGMKGLVGMLR